MFAYMEPFVLLYDPAVHHIIMCVLVGRPQIDMVPPVALQRLLEHRLQLRRHLCYLRCRVLYFFGLRRLIAPH